MQPSPLSPSNDFRRWREELLRVGRITQDDDDQTPEEQRVRDFERYIELVDGLDGSEGIDAVAALFESLQVRDDYGAYQGTHNALFRFPEEQYAVAFVRELPRLIFDLPDWAGDFLGQLAMSYPEGRSRIAAFNDEVARSPEKIRSIIVDFVRGQESDGWLDGRRKGRLCPASGLHNHPLQWTGADGIFSQIRKWFGRGPGH
jgi:hypothetical protein